MYSVDPVSIHQLRNSDLSVASAEQQHRDRSRRRGSNHRARPLASVVGALRGRLIPTRQPTMGPLALTHELFRGLGQSQLDSLATYVNLRACTTGESLGRQDEPSTGLVIIFQAQIGVSIDGVPITVLDDGSHFGSLPLLDGGEALQRASFDVLAPGRVGVVDKQEFRTVLDRFPTVAIWVYAMARSRRDYLGQLAACETSQSLSQSTQALLEYPVHLPV